MTVKDLNLLTCMKSRDRDSMPSILKKNFKYTKHMKLRKRLKFFKLIFYRRSMFDAAKIIVHLYPLLSFLSSSLESAE